MLKTVPHRVPPRTPRACFRFLDSILMLPLVLDGPQRVPDATYICLARSTRQGSGEQVFHNTKRSHAATSDEGSSTVLARQWRLVGESREDGCSTNAAGLLIALVPTKMGGSSHYE